MISSNIKGPIPGIQRYGLLFEDNDISQNSKHLIGSRGLIQPLQNGALHLSDWGRDKGPGDLVVPPFQQVVQGPG